MRTTAGTDFVCAVQGTTGAQPAAANYLALTANTAAPAAADTVLTGEITTAGLARKQATYAHTTGTASYTLTATFTAVAADVAGGSVTVPKTGTLNAATGGVLVYEDLLMSGGSAAPATFAAAGDAMTATQTVSP